MKTAQIVALFALAGLGAQGRQPEPAGTVTIFVDDQSGMPISELLVAEVKAKHMFAAIGVRIAWSPGSGESAHRPSGGGCGAGIPIKLRITGREADTPAHGVLGYAFPYAGGNRSIVIKYDAIGVAQPSVARESLLAHVIAHEITHVLQRVEGHSLSGLMQSHWTPDEVRGMFTKPLGFTPEDAALVHRGIEHLAKQAAEACSTGR